MILNNIVKLMHAWMTVGLVSDSIRVGPRPGGWRDGGLAESGAESGTVVMAYTVAKDSVAGERRGRGYRITAG